MSAQGFWELRLYEMLPRRLPDMHHQFAREVPPLFERAGIPAPLAYWDCFAGPMTAMLAYILHWPDLDARMAAWGRFYTDPQWWKQYEDAHGGEQMLERSHVLVLRPSPAWSAAPSGPHLQAGLHELRMVDLLSQAAGAAHDALVQVDLPCIEAQGAQVLGLFDQVMGQRLPRAVVLLAWPDLATREAAWTAHAVDPAVMRARTNEHQTHGAPLVGSTEAFLLRPAPYGARWAGD
ncbi:MAG: NIPSNAP family protein [Hydrogenophaga sp.]|uniref:NIPSNAP family protein n=1 Tax=Hydrogenophaga sp. TaxID=1904254 RepID=UPI003D103507